MRYATWKPCLDKIEAELKRRPYPVDACVVLMMLSIIRVMAIEANHPKTEAQ